ncbi:hypothetical protein F4679DRAFT_597388 [Xylaria curta]|nr:hypothetical protein F4679DRAFT_597388 [Xylaria curta]
MPQMSTLTQPLEVGREDIWEQHKPTLHQLYQTQRKTLSEVKTLMERDHGFPATPLSTYESKLRQMRVRKKMKKTDWHAVYQELQRRGERQSAVYLCGTKIPSTKAWKEIRRSGARSSHDGQRRQLPREVVVRTPSPGRQSPPLPLVFQNPSIELSRSVLSSQTIPAMLQMTTRPPLDMSSCEGIRILDLPNTISDFYKTFLKDIPSQIFTRELLRTLEKSSTVHSVARGDHLDPINLRYVSGAAYMLSNQLLDPADRHLYLGIMFTYFTDFIIPLVATDLPTLRVMVDPALQYIFQNYHRDEFQALVRVIARHNPDWLAPESYKYLIYAATMNCLDVCRLLLENVKTMSSNYVTKQRNLDYALYNTAISSAISAGYFDCVRFLIRHMIQNYPLPRGCDPGTTPPPYQTGQNDVMSHNQGYQDNQITSLFLNAMARIGRGGLHCDFMLHGPVPGLPRQSYCETETVQHVVDIFREFGLDIDAPMPPWFLGGRHNLYGKDLKILCLYPDFQIPIHMYPTVLDILYYIDKDAYRYLAPHSKKIATKVTRSGLYIAAERGSDSLYQYLNSSKSPAAECQELLELVLVEQFVMRFNYNITYTLLNFGVGFGAFPQDMSLSIPLEGLLFEIKHHGMKTELLGIFNHLLREGAIIDADVIAAAVEPHGTNLLNFLAGYGADFATNGTLALLVAAKLDNFEATDWLLETGVDINAGIDFHGHVVSVIGSFIEGSYSSMDLHQRPQSSQYGCFNGLGARENSFFDHKMGATVPMLKKLIDRGAALSTRPGNLQPNNFLYLAIRVAMYRSDIPDIVTYIIVSQGGIQIPLYHQPCLLEACFDPAFVSSKETLDHGLQIFNILLAYGVPIANSGVLVCLIDNGATIDLVQMVIDRGANINAYSNDHSEFECPRWTPLQMAASVGDLELVKMLVGSGARINAPAKDYGMTALQAACDESREERGNRIALVKFLINNGADVNAPGSPVCGRTALQIAASHGNIEIAAVLLDHGADVNAPSSDLTEHALDHAALEGRLDMTKFLLDLGAVSWDREGNDYAGAIKFAERGCHWAVADLLREHAVLSTQIRRALEGDEL